MNYLFVLAFLSLASLGWADVLGSFSKTSLHPGFLDLNNNQGIFKPNIKEKKYDDGIDRRTPSQILKSYLNDDMTFNTAKANKFISLVYKLQKNAFLAYCSTKLPSELNKSHDYCKLIKWRDLDSTDDKNLKKFIKKWQEEKAFVSCNVAISKMRSAMTMAAKVDFSHINDPNYFDFIEDFFTAIEIFETIKGEDAYWGRATSKVNYYKKVAESLVKTYKIKSSTKEAANILIPEKYNTKYPNQLFFSPAQLEELKKQSVDISQFDPIESGFWRKPEISFKYYDPKTYSRQGLESLKSGLNEKQIEDLLDPEQEIILEYIPKDKSRGETPKIEVLYGQKQKWKLKFLTDKGPTSLPTMSLALAVQRVIISSETNIEPAVNNLAAAIGYTVDPTYYKKSVRMYLPKEAYEQDFERYLEEEVVQVLEKRFKASWNVRSAFKQIKTDEKGIKYIEFKGVTLEKKSDIKTDLGVSFFVRHHLGKSFKREFRAFALFLALIADPDIKDDNTKIKLIPVKNRHGEKSFKLAFTASDMGIALGFGFPNIYPKKMVSKVKRHKDGSIKEIKLNYRTFFPLPIFQALSMADARWLMRIIAQIPKEKIYEIFRSAGYPELVATYYKEIFLHRCDQLYDALGLLGETFTGYDGEKVHIEKKSNINNRKTFAVKGAEKFFTKGKLQDPENKLFDKNTEHFARNWGTALSFDVEGQHKKEIYNLLKKGLVLQGGNIIQKTLLDNFQFSNLLIGGGNTNIFCKNKCFFSGFKFGVDWFIPTRFVVPNPTAEVNEYPYWVIDLFRFAFTLGAGTQGILAKLALSTTPQILGLGGEFVKGFDFIKIRPVANYADAVGHLNNNDGATRKYLLRDINKQVIADMREGDILVASSYVGSRGALALRPAANAFASPAVGPMGEIMYLNRAYVLKGHDNKILVNWANIKNLNLSMSAYIDALFLRVPILKAEYTKSTEKHRVFEFDFNDKLAQAELINNINKTNPTNIDEKYKFKTKTVRFRGLNFTMNFFSLNKWLMAKKKTEVVGQDYISGNKVHEIAYERSKKHRIFKHKEFVDRNKINIKAQLSSTGDLYVKFDLAYFQNQTYRQDFLKIIKKTQAFLPKDFIIFDPNLVKYYLGEFELNSTVIINSNGLRDLFGYNGPSDQEICQTYAKVQKIPSEHVMWCKKVLKSNLMSLYNRRAKNFIGKFNEVRELYQEFEHDLALNKKIDLSDKESKSKAYNLLKGLVDILHENTGAKKVIDILQDNIRDENIFRKVYMSSFLEGFPGLLSTIGNSDASDGGLIPNERHMIIEVDDVFKIFTDEIDAALAGKLRSRISG